MLALMLIPLTLGGIVGLLVLAAGLERRSTEVLVRMSLRAKMEPELTEKIIAAELAAVLDAAGLDRPAPSDAA